MRVAPSAPASGPVYRAARICAGAGLGARWNVGCEMTLLDGSVRATVVRAGEEPTAGVAGAGLATAVCPAVRGRSTFSDADLPPGSAARCEVLFTDGLLAESGVVTGCPVAGPATIVADEAPAARPLPRMMIGARPEGTTVAPVGAAGVPFCDTLFAAPFTAGTCGLIAD
jgi:hypothetical protein